MQAPSRITDVSAAWPTLSEVADVLLFRAGYNTSIVVLAATLLGMAGGMIGTFALLRKRALMSDALAHCTLPGIALAFLVFYGLGRDGRTLPVLLTGAAITGVIGVLCVQGMVRYTRLREDAAIGAVLSVFFGIGIVLLSIIQNLRSASAGGLSHFIYGQTAAMQVGDAVLIGAAAALVLAVTLAFFKELRLVCFDERFAQAQGLPVGAIDLLMMSLVVIVTVIGLQAVGLILVVAMLIIPPAGARFWSERLSVVVWLAGGLGALSGYLGAAASSLLPRLPAGAVIVVVAGFIFLVSMLLAPRRGAIAALVRHLRLRLHIASDHLLRALFEASEGHEHTGTLARARMPLRELAHRRGWSMPRTLLLGWVLRGLRLVDLSGGTIAMTGRGRREAERITRNHRLWEEFLITHAELAASHVDRSADMVEHVLSEDIVRDLETALARRGVLVPASRPLPSVHPIGPERQP